ncbi:MAG: hypothetical protein K6B40_04450 [Firmicutes bacterium]|nr:hypothetical protein [Bacillota bacterium]
MPQRQGRFLPRLQREERGGTANEKRRRKISGHKQKQRIDPGIAVYTLFYSLKAKSLLGVVSKTSASLKRTSKETLTLLFFVPDFVRSNVRTNHSL